MPPLIVRYGQEFPKIDGVVGDPDWTSLFRMTAGGTLRIVTVRDADVLVGFAFNIVGTHLMYRDTVHGLTNAVWLDPRYRTGWFPVKFLRYNLAMLREWGCKRVCIAEDATKDRSLRKVYERLGYKLDELSYARSL